MISHPLYRVPLSKWRCVKCSSSPSMSRSSSSSLKQWCTCSQVWCNQIKSWWISSICNDAAAYDEPRASYADVATATAAAIAAATSVALVGSNWSYLTLGRGSHSGGHNDWPKPSVSPTGLHQCQQRNLHMGQLLSPRKDHRRLWKALLCHPHLLKEWVYRRKNWPHIQRRST